MEVGDIVVFKRLINGEYKGVSKELYLVIENNLKYGEVDIRVESIKTKEKVYTNSRILELVKDQRINIQLTLFD